MKIFNLYAFFQMLAFLFALQTCARAHDINKSTAEPLDLPCKTQKDHARQLIEHAKQVDGLAPNSLLETLATQAMMLFTGAKTCLENTMEDTQSVCELGTLHVKLKQYQEATETLHLISHENANDVCLFPLSLAYCKLQQFDKMLEVDKIRLMALNDKLVSINEQPIENHQIEAFKKSCDLTLLSVCANMIKLQQHRGARLSALYFQTKGKDYQENISHALSIEDYIEHVKLFLDALLNAFSSAHSDNVLAL